MTYDEPNASTYWLHWEPHHHEIEHHVTFTLREHLLLMDSECGEQAQVRPDKNA